MIAGLTMGSLFGSTLQRHVSMGETIVQAESCADHLVPEVLWDQYGVVPTNEVAVVARCGALQFYASAPSHLLVPLMGDRIWGLDVADERLGQELTEALWRRFGSELVAEALRIRTERGR